MEPMIHPSSRPFPKHVTLTWTDKVEGTEATHRHELKRGCNAVFKTLEGRLFVRSKGEEVLEAAEDIQQGPEKLAIIYANLVNFDGEEIVQLELSTTTTQYICVQRGGITAVILSPSSDKTRCCCLSSGDTIKFTSTNTSIMVSLKPAVQVDSSLPMELEETVFPAEVYATASTSLDVLGTPNISVPDEKVKETPAREIKTANLAKPDYLNSADLGPDEAETVARKSKDATESESEGEDESNASKFDFQSLQPSVTTVTQKSRKRALDSEVSPINSITKKSRKEDTDDDDEIERVTTLDEDDPSLQVEAVTKKRGRTKKALAATPKSKASPSVLIGRNSSRKVSATPESTARSSVSTNDPAPSPFGGQKPTVAFSSSGFTELPQQMKMLKTVITLSSTFNKKVDILCIGGGLKKTPKILSAVALGKLIVSESWAKACAKEKTLLDPQNYLARDEDKENEWNVPATWSAGEASRADLFKGYTLYVSPSLKKDYGSGYKDIEDLAKLVGVNKIVSKSSREAPDKDEKTVLLGLARGDLDAVALHDKDRKVYEKDFLPMSILRGVLCFDEFVIEPEEGLPGVSKRKGRGGKGGKS